MEAKGVLCFAALIVALFAGASHGLCLPCPREGITIKSYTECECPLGTFHDSIINKCVDYFQCPPLPPVGNPFAELKSVAPALYDTVANSMEFVKQQPRNWEMSKDYHMTRNAFGNRMEEIKKNLPGLLGPIVAPVLIKNKDILHDCKGQALCVLIEALKKEDNFSTLFPKLKPVALTILQQFMMAFEDLEHMSKESTFESCPVIKGFSSMKSYVPKTLGEMQKTIGESQGLREFSNMAVHLKKFLMGDLKKYLPFLNFNM